VETIKEFDLGKGMLFLCFQTMIESMSFSLHTIQKCQIDLDLIFELFPQVIDGKIYFLENYNRRQNDSPPIRQVLAFDLGAIRFLFFITTNNLDSLSWTEVETESFPNLKKIGRTYCYNNHLVFYPIVDGETSIFGEFWSLSLRIIFQVFCQPKY